MLTGFTDVLRRQWRAVATAVLVCVGLALVLTEVQGRRYQSTTRLLVSGAAAQTAPQAAAAERAALFARIVPTGDVLAAAVQGADAMFRTTLSGAHVTATAHAGHGSALLTITVTADDPDTALQVAKAYPVVLPGQLVLLHEAPAIPDALLTIVHPAERAGHPSSPRPARNLLAGLGAGILLGAAAAAARDRFGTGLRDAREIAPLARGNLLAVVAREFDDEHVVVDVRPDSRRALGYREVRATLESHGAPRSLVVTSAGAGEGTSALAANLAVLYERAGSRAAVVDASLPPTAWPAGCDVLIVDAPPVLSGDAADALLLGALTDGIVLVARPGRVTRHRLRRALDAIEQSHARLLGVVVNAAPAEQQEEPAPAPPPLVAVAAAPLDWRRADLLEQPRPTFRPRSPAARRAAAPTAPGRRTRE